MAVVELAEDIAAMGYAPVTASTPAGVVVTVDSSFVPAAAPSVSCDGPGADALQLCRGLLIGGRPGSPGRTVAVGFLPNGPAEMLVLEIVPATDTGTGAPIARTFVRFQNDYAPPDVPLSCERARSPRLDLTGTLTINTLDIANPSATHGHLVLDLPGGGHAIVDF